MSWREWPVRLCENTHWFHLALSDVTYSCELLVRHWDWQKTGAADGRLQLFVVVFPAGFICGSTACAILCWGWKTGPLKLINSVHRVPGTHCRTFLISFKMTNAKKKKKNVFNLLCFFFFLFFSPLMATYNIGGFLCQFVLIECLVFTAVPMKHQTFFCFALNINTLVFMADKHTKIRLYSLHYKLTYYYYYYFYYRPTVRFNIFINLTELIYIWCILESVLMLSQFSYSMICVS